MPNFRFSTSVTVLTLSLFLAACGTEPVKHQSTDKNAEFTQINVQSVLKQARDSESPRREQLYLQAANALYHQGDAAWARNLLADLQPSRLADADYINYVLLFSEIALADDSMFLAQRILSNPRLEQNWHNVDAAQETLIRERRARVFAALGEAIDSIKERLSLDPILVDSQAEYENREALWRTLMSLPDSQLSELSQTEANQTLRGWYSLAKLSKNTQTDLNEQLQQVHNWQRQWPQHPASRSLPEDLKLLNELIAERPQNIALLLPVTGPLAEAGKAIRDGFMASYYDSLGRNHTTPIVEVYDTTDRDINEVYDQAVAAGANLVVGPLDKAKVADLNFRTQLPVPTIALNYIDIQAVNTTTQPNTKPAETVYADNLYQFGLSADDEAEQVAQRAWLDTHRKAMIIAPRTAWGERTLQAFRERWESYGGTVVSQALFSDQREFSQTIKNNVGVTDSQQRARDLRALFGPGYPFEYEPRRRQDIDMIFLLARPSEARQLKPMLAFYYAGDIPVYATSHVYAGVSDPSADRDINGIRFNTLPWFFGQAKPVKQAIDKFAQAKPEYQGLYALGADVFQLYPRLKQLQAIPETRLYGTTGALHLTNDRKIHREQVWAQIIGGVARPMPMVVSQQ